MNIKQKLVQLYSHYHSPMAEYSKLEAFRFLENQPDVIEKIESYRLPEVTKLICGSEILMALPWAEKYKDIKPFYCIPNYDKYISDMLKFSSGDDFAKAILDFADESIFSLYNDYIEKLFGKKSDIKGQLRSAEKSKEESQEKINLSNEKSICSKLEKDVKKFELEIENLRKNLDEIEKTLSEFRIYTVAIKKSQELIKTHVSDENREEVYNLLKNIIPAIIIPYEEQFVKKFIAFGILSSEDQSKLKEPFFVKKMLDCLEKKEYKLFMMPILLKLYENGMIDLGETIFDQYLNKHSGRLCEYLIDQCPEDITQIENSDFSFLIEKAILIQLSEKGTLASYWNTITDSHLWEWVIKKIDSLEFENLNQSIACIASEVEGRTCKILLETLQEMSKTDKRISVMEICFNLLNLGKGKDFIWNVMRSMEKQTHTMQKSLNTAERMVRTQGQELFSAIYEPLQQLEELAIDIKTSNNEIKNSLIAKHLIDIIIELREGLTVSDLHPAVDTNDWKEQNDITYDASVHAEIIFDSNDPTVVHLRNLGARYQNEEGEWQVHRAKVFSPQKQVSTLMFPRKGYPKYEQPGKSNKQRGDISDKPQKTLRKNRIDVKR